MHRDHVVSSQRKDILLLKIMTSYFRKESEATETPHIEDGVASLECSRRHDSYV